ncbi:ATP-binding protein [bacterium]|nr:ATP-binding protein [bacterium]
MQDRIIEALIENNKWWKRAFKVDYKPREIYTQIKKYQKTKQIVALTGLRRVGKTYLMFKMVQDNFDEYGNENILYFAFDDFRDVKIKDVIKSYSRLMNKELDKGKYFFLFDEIQKVADWEEQIKRVYDNNTNIKIVISGSESLCIKQKSRESLAGRIYVLKVDPLIYREFINFKGIKVTNLELQKEELLREFENFLYTSGFPEIIDEDRDIVEKYIEDNVIGRIIYRDIPQIFPIGDSYILEKIFKVIHLSPGQIINMTDLGNQLEISRQTTSRYLDYLEQSFLLKKLYNYSRSERKSQRKLKKYYPTIIGPELMKRSHLRGKIFETSMVLQLNAEFFWRDVYKNEVDVVLVKDDKPIPVEIRQNYSKNNGLDNFLRKFKVNKALYITYDSEGKRKINGNDIQVQPFYRYFL